MGATFIYSFRHEEKICSQIKIIIYKKKIFEFIVIFILNLNYFFCFGDNSLSFGFLFELLLWMSFWLDFQMNQSIDILKILLTLWFHLFIFFFIYLFVLNWMKCANVWLLYLIFTQILVLIQPDGILPEKILRKTFGSLSC